MTRDFYINLLKILDVVGVLLRKETIICNRITNKNNELSIIYLNFIFLNCY